MQLTVHFVEHLYNNKEFSRIFVFKNILLGFLKKANNFEIKSPPNDLSFVSTLNNGVGSRNNYFRIEDFPVQLQRLVISIIVLYITLAISNNIERTIHSRIFCTVSITFSHYVKYLLRPEVVVNKSALYYYRILKYIPPTHNPSL